MGSDWSWEGTYESMDRETLAEVLANLSGKDPNDDVVWVACLAEADDIISMRIEWRAG